MDQNKIGKFIAERRKILGMTQKELAAKLGITDRAVSKWENGRCMPDMSLLLPLSRCLSVDVNDLLSGEIITEQNRREKSEENIVKLAEINYLKGFRYGFMFLLPLFAGLIIYCLVKGLETAGFVALLSVFDGIVFYYRYHTTKDRNSLYISIIWMVAAIINIVAFIIRTW